MIAACPRFLYYKTSPEYQYYELRVRELEGSKNGSSVPGLPAVPPLPRTAAVTAARPAAPLPLPRVNRFSEQKSEGETTATFLSCAPGH